MIFEQLFDTKSSTYTYLISSGKGREALIIDPVIENVAGYVNLLKSLNLKLVKVIDTHIHADHVTGASKLKDITKCTTIMGEHSPAETVEIKVKDDEYINLAITVTGHQVLTSSDLLKMIFEICSLPENIKWVEPSSNSQDHYSITPYKFKSVSASKMVPKHYIDLGQGIFEIVEEIFHEMENCR